MVWSWIYGADTADALLAADLATEQGEEEDERPKRAKGKKARKGGRKRTQHWWTKYIIENFKILKNQMSNIE